MDDPTPDPTPPQPELDFDGRYRVERVGGAWFLLGPAFAAGMRVGGGQADPPAELIEKYRDVADLMNRAVDAERRRGGASPRGR